MDRAWVFCSRNKICTSQISEILFASAQFPALSFCRPHEKPHGVQGLSKHDHLQIDQKIGNSKCDIRRIPCVCNTFTKMLDKPW